MLTDTTAPRRAHLYARARKDIRAWITNWHNDPQPAVNEFPERGIPATGHALILERGESQVHAQGVPRGLSLVPGL